MMNAENDPLSKMFYYLGLLLSVINLSTSSFLECSEPASEIRPISDFGTLILSSVMFRHGERNIIKPYPTDPYSERSYWPEGFGQLIKTGKKREYDIGTWLRERYRNILPSKYLPDYVYVRSTDVDRTLMSATAALASLFFPPEKDIFQKGLNWQPIPVHTVPEYLDEVLSSKKPCPKYNITLEAVLNSPEMNAFNKKNEEFYLFLTNKTGMGIKDIRDVANLYDVLYIENLRNLSLPDWTNDIFPDKLVQFSAYSFHLSTIVHELKLLKSGPLIKEIVNHMAQKVNHSLIPDRTLFLYSAHDDTISSLLNSLGVFNCISPPYGATVLIELWETETLKYVVTVSYRNVTDSEPFVFIIPGCSAACPLEEFVKLVSNIIPEDWEHECQIDIIQYNLELKFFKIFSLILSAGIIMLIAINVLTLCCRRKEETSYKYQQISTETS